MTDLDTYLATVRSRGCTSLAVHLGVYLSRQGRVCRLWWMLYPDPMTHPGMEERHGPVGADTWFADGYPYPEPELAGYEPRRLHPPDGRQTTAQEAVLELERALTRVGQHGMAITLWGQGTQATLGWVRLTLDAARDPVLAAQLDALSVGGGR